MQSYLLSLLILFPSTIYSQMASTSFEIKRARGKTAVFSGARQHCDYVPRLEDLCIQKLLNNLNRIECVGDVPYYILKPLLTKISLSQLKRIESYNPQIIDDEESDEPWKAHCQRDFDKRIPNKEETWRELYFRCEKERQHRLEKVTKKIKKHEKRAAPARQARVVDHHIPTVKSRASSAITVSSTSSSSSSSASRMKPKVAPLMQKSMQLFKSRFRR